MAKKNIGATLSIKDGNFTTGIKNAVTGLKNLKKSHHQRHRKYEKIRHAE